MERAVCGGVKEMNAVYADFVAGQLNSQDPVHITTTYGILGSIESTVALDAFSVMLEGEKIDGKGADLVGENPKLLAPPFPGMQTGLFVKNGDNLIHQAETVDGKLIVNNKQLALSGPREIQPTSTDHKGRAAGRR